MVVEDGSPVLRATDYDLDAAVAELRSSGFPDVDEQVAESLLDPVDPDWVAAFFEHGAGPGRGPGAAATGPGVITPAQNLTPTHQIASMACIS